MAGNEGAGTPPADGQGGAAAGQQGQAGGAAPPGQEGQGGAAQGQGSGQQGGQGQGQGGSPPGQQQGQAGQFILTQDQFNARWAERMSGLEKDLGLPPGGLKDHIEAQKKAKLPPGETLTGPELRIAKMEALMTLGVASRQIPLILQHFQIAGKTRGEIEASIQNLISLKLLTVEGQGQAGQGQQQGQQQQPGQPPAGAQGAGIPGNPSGALPRIWTASEIKKICADPSKVDQKVLDEINKAQKEGRVNYNA